MLAINDRCILHNIIQVNIVLKDQEIAVQKDGLTLLIFFSRMVMRTDDYNILCNILAHLNRVSTKISTEFSLPWCFLQIFPSEQKMGEFEQIRRCTCIKNNNAHTTKVRRTVKIKIA